MSPGRSHCAGIVLATLLALVLLCLPGRAEANVGCSITPNPPSLNFGTSSIVTATVGYRCQNFDSFARSFTLCLRVGTSSFPGTASQPALQNGNNRLNYNVYKDAAGTVVWTASSPFTASLSLRANETVTGSFTYYGRIAAGQTVPEGSYSGQLFNTVLGFLSGGTCQQSVGDLSGQDATVLVTATIAAGCTLSTIGALDFGSQPALVQRIDAAGSVQLTCPLGRSWTLRFDGGRNASGGVRRMIGQPGNFIPYGLFRDSGRTSSLAIDGSLAGTGTGAAQTTVIYGRAEPASPPPSGQYQDFVVVTLSF